MAGINDEVAALDFDLACTVRLSYYDAETAKTQAKLNAYEVSKLFGSGESDSQSEAAEVW